MNCRQALSQTVAQPPCLVSRSAVTFYRPIGLRQHPIAICAAAAEGTAEDATVVGERPQQPTAEQQQRQGKKQLKARIKRLASSWKDNSTPNTGLVSVTRKSLARGAAACVTADLKEKSFTRLVAHTTGDIPRAINVINIATQMINGRYSSEDELDGQQQQQQQQQQKPDISAGKRVLVFQPVRVDGVLVAPPALPEGAAALYTYMLPADCQALQVAMGERAKMLEAVAAASSSSSGGSRRLSAADGVVSVSGSSNVRGAARAVVEAIRTKGWAELTSYGGPLATQIAIEALMTARGVLYRQSNQDVAAVFLEFWKKEKTAAAAAGAGQWQHSEVAPSLAEAEQQLQESEEIRPLPFRCATFLLVACAKNKPQQPVVPQQQQ